jgi:hypothetical protein
MTKDKVRGQPSVVRPSNFELSTFVCTLYFVLFPWPTEWLSAKILISPFQGFGLWLSCPNRWAVPIASILRPIRGWTVLTSDASQFLHIGIFKILNLNAIKFIIVTFTALKPVLLCVWIWKVRRTNNGWLVPNFVLRLSYFELLYRRRLHQVLTIGLNWMIIEIDWEQTGNGWE